MTNDQINGLIELLGSLFVLNHCRVLFKDKVVGGVSVISTVFFQVWGIWNIWYYPSLEQWYSFAGGLCIVVANTLWVFLLLKYRIQQGDFVIQINRHPAGRISNMIFGLCAVADGLVRFLSLGFLHSTFCLDYARRQAKRSIVRAKKQLIST